MVCSGVELGRAVPFAPALLLGILVRVLYVSVGGTTAATERLGRQGKEIITVATVLQALRLPRENSLTKTS